MVVAERLDRQSDGDSSRRAGDSDSHPENWTDYEASDTQVLPNNNNVGPTGSPPKNNELKEKNENKEGGGDRKSRLFARDKGTPGTNKTKKHSLSVDLVKPGGDFNNSEVRVLFIYPDPFWHFREYNIKILSLQPRKALVEQLGRVLPDDTLPDSVALVSLSDPGGAVLSTRLQERNLRVLTTASPADVRATFTCLIARIQKFCNSSAKPPAPVKVVIAGGDGFVNTVLRHYVDLLSFRPPDWQNYLRFLVVPLGTNNLSKYLASIDSRYAMLFGDEWRELAEREVSNVNETVARISEYLVSSNSTLLLPIAEAMVTYRYSALCESEFSKAYEFCIFLLLESLCF